MTLLEKHREALRVATYGRLLLHTDRLDRIARRYGYENPKLDAAEQQRADEFCRRYECAGWSDEYNPKLGRAYRPKSEDA